MISFFQSVEFKHPWVLLLLAIPVLLGAWYALRLRWQQASLTISEARRGDAKPTVKSAHTLILIMGGAILINGLIMTIIRPMNEMIFWIPTLALGLVLAPPNKVYRRLALPVFSFLAIAALIGAIARPQSRLSEEEIVSEGIDIVLVMDVSTSMLAKDFEPNRLEASKEVAADFIRSRPNDRVGLVVFAGEAFTQTPITVDHEVVIDQLMKITNGLIADGTAVGMGLGTAVNRLRESTAESKVVILLTDGVNNAGYIEPLTAAEAAKQMDVTVYTVGVGSKGKALAPVYLLPNGQLEYDYVDVDIDEATLKQVSQKTGGLYFRATDRNGLESVYKQIDQLEKTKIEVQGYTKTSEEFLPFALIAGFFFLLERLLRYTLLRSLP